METEVGKTILKQLGGGKFLAMTGATVVLTPYGLSMKLPIGKLTGMTVELSPDDTYEIQGYKGRGLKFKKSGEPETGVYSDSLKLFFTGMTGLAVSL